MPAKLSAAKRQRQSEVRRVRNRAIRSRVRTSVRRVRESIEAGDRAVVETGLRAVTRELDRAVSKSVLTRNSAARYKGRLHRAAHRVVGSSSAAPAKPAPAIEQQVDHAPATAEAAPIAAATTGADATQE